NSPSRGLSVTQQPGIKKDRARILLMICTNFTGSEKLPIWMIGKAKKPRALAKVNIQSLGGVWRWNTKAWANTDIIKEWLEHFYIHIGPNRKAILLWDNFSAHKSGLHVAPPPPNIQVLFLPPNPTSRYQPLDQGIIQNL